MTLVIATRNAHKTEEIQSILGPALRLLTLNDFSLAPSVIEDTGSFVGNATKKAVALAHHIAGTFVPRPGQPALDSPPEEKTGERKEQDLSRFPARKPGPSSLWVLADDSGLEVDALNGAPGVHSARFAALDSGAPGNAPDYENNAKLLRLLREVPAAKRTARFRCVLALTPVTADAAASASPVCYADETELQTEIFEGICEGTIAFAPSGQGGFGYDPLFLPLGQSQSFAELGAEAKNRLSHRAKALEGLARFLASHST